MSTYIICHGCQGKGWVDSVYYGPSKCPLCNGTGVESTYTTINSLQETKMEEKQ